MGTAAEYDPAEAGAGDPVEIAIAALRPADTPRSGRNDEHVRLLAESAELLPPLLVHRASMRVIDGMHRLYAAELLGAQRISVRFFDGDEQEAFLLAVRLNSAHGLPLSLAERKNAARRILSYFPERSDRAVAALSGVSDKTVAAIRRSTTELTGPEGRIGRDGGVRPVDPAAGRLRAAEVFRANPALSSRAVARSAGISVATAKDVRDRLGRSEDPLRPRQVHAASGVPQAALRVLFRRTRGADRTTSLAQVRNDPSLRFSESGRTLLRWLEASGADDQVWHRIAESLPAHAVSALAELARNCAEDWLRFAELLDQRVKSAS
ncbi:ParB-like nuclease domain-containing protein [Nocardia sp. 2]|uniref:ParB-like nuclease domain-containing protein n=1 Tax=Nocardia acididurans TaxID=2802282 RepID=A0ABS1MCF1_9NOCA|nr:ParB/RepB/Spo0J family partition protein [Nocardia acididurans]MBL1078312.1 ParB-like nuclease domain-containing protein [Nocardia acididurans]